MKTATYETAYSYTQCPILEHADLDAMTDDELRVERENWIMSLGDDDPAAWDVERNYRLCERHLELRAMSDEDLTAGLAQARWAVEHWSKKEDDWLAARMIREWSVDAEEFERELTRRNPEPASETEGDDDAERLNDLHAQIEDIERALDEDRFDEEDPMRERLHDLEAEADLLMERLSEETVS